jgi:hypothetical protein
MAYMMVSLCVCLLVVTTLSGMAACGVPCPQTSTVEASGDGSCAPDAMVCPGSDADHITVEIILRDCFAEPMEGYMVLIVPFQVEGDTYICPGQESMTAGPTDADGKTESRFESFGGCGTVRFNAAVNSVEIGTSNVIAVVTPDRDGDGIVSLVDFGHFATKYLTDETCSDFDCTGVVDLIDFGLYARHYQHACP